jgi:hypothetical protein
MVFLTWRRVRLKRSTVYILIALVLSVLGVAEDHFETLIDYAPEFLWTPVLAWCGALFFICLWITSSFFGQFVPLKSWLPLLVAIGAFGYVLNGAIMSLPETVVIEGGFDGTITDEKWAEIEARMTPEVMQLLFWDVFDEHFSYNGMGIKDIKITRSTRLVPKPAGAPSTDTWTSWSISVTCLPRRIPRKYMKSVIPLVVSYFGARMQFSREWKDSSETHMKHRQAAHNFMIELRLAGFSDEMADKALEGVSRHDENGRVCKMFADQLARKPWK